MLTGRAIDRNQRTRCCAHIFLRDDGAQQRCSNAREVFDDVDPRGRPNQRSDVLGNITGGQARVGAALAQRQQHDASTCAHR
eukprot:6549134-Pyramimonas_sp.AAC.1